MWNEIDIVYQAQERKRENLNWIIRESKVHRGFDSIERGVDSPIKINLNWAIELLKSLNLLKEPGVEHSANR